MEHTIEGRTYILVPMTKEEIDSEVTCAGCVDENYSLGICSDLEGCTYAGNKNKVWKEKPQQ